MGDSKSSARTIEWGGDDQYLTDLRQHQRAQRVINHRFVVDWKAAVAAIQQAARDVHQIPNDVVPAPLLHTAKPHQVALDVSSQTLQ